MRKLSAYLVGAVVMITFILVAWFLYSQFDASTEMLIIVLTLLMVGTMVTITVINRMLHRTKKKVVEQQHYPMIEKDLLRVTPEGFCEKLNKKYKGNLYFIAPDLTEKEIILIEGIYNKLTDQIQLKFTRGVNTIIKGADFFEVGDYQFMLRKFDKMIHTKAKQKITLRWNRSHLVQLKEKEEVPISLPIQLPVLLFDWHHHPEQTEN